MEIKASQIRFQIRPILDAAEAGNDVILTRQGRKVARVIKYEPAAEPENAELLPSASGER